jgi:hypothetical protein
MRLKPAPIGEPDVPAAPRPIPGETPADPERERRGARGRHAGSVFGSAARSIADAPLPMTVTSCPGRSR